MARNAPVIIAVDGRSGAGKSTLALELATLLRRHREVSLFHLEDLYPGWDGLAEGIERYVRTVLEPLHWGETAWWRAWDWAGGTDGERRSTSPAPVVVVEGVGAASAAARRYLDAVVWVESDDDERRRRALARDGETYAPHWERWAEQELAWLAGANAPAPADVVVANHGDPSGNRSPADALAALLHLPALAPVLAPELHERGALPLREAEVPLPPGTTAAGLFESLFGASNHAVFLDSSSAGTPDPGGRNRFSILADDGGALGAVALHRNGTTEVANRSATVRVPGPFFRWLDTVWGRPRLAGPGTGAGTAPGGAAPFRLGWLGWLGYELKRETGGSDVATAGDGLPDAALLHAGRAVVVDHKSRSARLLALDGPGAGAWLAETAGRIAEGATAAPAEPPAPPIAPPPRFRSADTRDAYLAKVRAAQAEIRDGNTYEVCLTTRLQACAAADALDPWRVYRALRRNSPAPFAAYLRFGDAVLASTSPERLVGIGADGRMRAEPIKGTRRRSPDPAEDARLREDLAASPKDRAENIMIVDLLRNDLVRSSDPATLTVPRLCAVETYATVHQMVSTIDATLRPEVPRAEAVAAAFPGGSMTGAPKVSTMAILDRLEDGRPRGPYSGALGYFSHDGAADLSVVIRTLAMHRDGDWRLSLGLGGAVTADSVPEEEWDEVRTKSRGVLGALGAEFPGE